MRTRSWQSRALTWCSSAPTTCSPTGGFRANTTIRGCAKPTRSPSRPAAATASMRPSAASPRGPISSPTSCAWARAMCPPALISAFCLAHASPKRRKCTTSSSTIQNDAGARSRHVRHPVEELVERDRIVAHTHAGGVVDRVGDGGADTAHAELAAALRLHGRGDRIGLVKEDHFLMRNVGMDRHFVTGKIVIDEEAVALVDHELLHERRAHPHGHRADHLAARGLRIEDATGGAHREHAPDANFGRRGINADFDEMRAER